MFNPIAQALNTGQMEHALAVFMLVVIGYAGVIAVTRIIDAASRNQYNDLPVMDTILAIGVFVVGFVVIPWLFQIVGLPFPNIIPGN